MAVIDSVKLPDNSTYDVADNYSGYAKKVSSATTDDLASLTATGDLADSGKKLSDLVLKSSIVNSLTSTATDVPLAANMGKTLEDEVEAIVNVYSAKNLLKNDATSTTLNTVAITVNDDKSVTLSGTASADSYLLLSQFTLDAGTYKLTGTPSGVSDEYLFAENLTNSAYYHDVGSGATFTLAVKSTIKAYIFTKASHAITSTYKPMIYDARIVDPTYEQYAETNQQLTVNKAERADLASLNLTGTKNTAGVTITSGTYFYLNGQYCITTQDILNNADFTENTNYLTTNVNNQLMVPIIVDSETITTYPTGIAALNGVETVKCCKYGNGQVVISGCITVANGGNGLAPGSVILLIPDRFRKPMPTGNRWLTIMSYMVSNPNGQPYLNACILHPTGHIQVWNRGMADDELMPIFITY